MRGISNGFAGFRWLHFWLPLLLAAGVTNACGQSAIDGFNVNVNAPVRVVVVQPDGKILIGGDFTTISTGVGLSFNRDRIARLNPDGSFDTAFGAGANDSVRAIAVQKDGKILVGGDFTQVNKTTRNRIARVDGKTGALDSFNPNANDFVTAIAVQTDTNILIGGAFTTIGGIARPRIARLDAASGAADSFRPNANAQVNAIVIQPDKRILVGGAFTTIGNQTRGHIARLDPGTAAADSFNPNSNGTVISIAVQSDGDVLVGGSFSGIGGRSRHRIARLDGASGAADNTFDPNANNDVISIAVQSEGKIVVSGTFSNIGGQTRNNIARLDTFTGLADSFDPNANNAVFSIAVQQDGKVVAGGFFTTLTPDTTPFALNHSHIARLEIDGRVDQTLDLGNIGGFVLATALQTDGKILIGGLFNSIFGITRHNIARLNTDGTLDLLFNPNPDNIVLGIAVQPDGEILIAGTFSMLSPDIAPPSTRRFIARLEPMFGSPDSFNPSIDGQVSALAVQWDNKILVGGTSGSFAHINGVTRHNIGRLNPDGSLDPNFNPNANGNVATIVVQPDKKILVGGTFHSFGGGNSIGTFPRNYIARLEPNFGIADAFDPNADGPVNAIALQPDSKILVGGGTFAHIGGAAMNNMARLDSAGHADTTFNPNPNGNVDSIVVQGDTKILVSGAFNRIGTFPRNCIARLEPTFGLADVPFNPSATNSGGFTEVDSIALQADGKILAGGSFNNIGGGVRFGFARLSDDTAALQSLRITQTSVTLTRDGSSPQFERVTFEFSTDNVNFTLLGDGTPSGNTWALNGLSLPIGQNFVVRARGFYHSGLFNGSESALGTRQSAFFPGSFVIGDGNAVVGQHVVFWGSQWAKSNSLSGGSAPSSFKGFANSTNPNQPACAGNWQSDPGNSASPPSSLPATINVMVASSITQSGNVISGNIPVMAVIQTDPGYDGSLGHPGTGTVVSVGCGR